MANRLIFFAFFFTVRSVRRGGQFPSFSVVRPCGDLAEVCQRKYFAVQQQAALGQVSDAGAAMGSSASNLLANVGVLKSTAENINSILDADNSRSNGGAIRQVDNERQLFGVDPFMGTLAGQLLAGNNVRVQAMSGWVSQILAGMDAVGQMLADANTRGSSQLLSTSETAKSGLSSASTLLTNLVSSFDAKFISDSAQFDSAQQSGPTAVQNSIDSGVASLNSDDNQSKLADIYTQITALGADLDSYQSNTVLGGANAFFQTQLAAATETKTADLNAFRTEASTKIAALVAQLKGVVATVKTDPFYSTSLGGYVDETTSRLSGDIAKADSAIQGQVNVLAGGLTAAQRLVASSFGPILDTMTTGMASLISDFAAFQAGSQRAIDSASTITAQGTKSFASFKTDLETIWNLTGNVLSGQTTTITADLLNQIGALTQAAGQEVNRLNDLMVDASSTALQSDAVRQDVLESARTQVESMVGSNEAGVNASFATITNFLATNKNDLAAIMNLVQLMAGTQAGNLSTTSNTSLAKTEALINTTKAQALGLLSGLTKTVLADMTADFATLGISFKSINSANANFQSQSQNLLSSAKTANLADFHKFVKNINASRSSLNTVIGTSRLLAGASDGVYADSQAAALNASNELAPVFTSAAGNLSQISANLLSLIASAQASLDNNNVASAASAAVATLQNTLGATSNGYVNSTKFVDAQFDGLVAKIGANRTLFESQISDLDARVLTLATSLAGLYRATGAQIGATSDQVGSQFAAIVAGNVSAAQGRLGMLLNTSIAAALANDGVSALTPQIIQLESDWLGLQNQIEFVQTTLPTNLRAQAANLANNYAAQIADLADGQYSSIAVESNESANSVNVFESDLALARSNLTVAKAAALQSAAAVEEAGMQQAELIGRKNFTVPTPAPPSDPLVGLRSMFLNLESDLNLANSSTNSKFLRAKLLADNLLNLNLDVNVAGSTAANLSVAFVNTTAALVQKFGQQIAEEIIASLDASSSKLTATQKEQVIKALLAANFAVDSAEVFADISKTMTVAIAAVLAGEPAPLQDVGPIGPSGKAVVEITASELAAIIALYSSDTAAERAALNASTGGNVTVGDALNVWNDLAASLGQISNDEVSNLLDFQDSVIAQVDAMRVADSGEMLESEISSFEKNATEFHSQILNAMANTESQLDGLDSDANNEWETFNAEVAAINSQLSAAAARLSSRESQILGQTSVFATALETAVLRDLA